MLINNLYFRFRGVAIEGIFKHKNPLIRLAERATWGTNKKGKFGDVVFMPTFVMQNKNKSNDYLNKIISSGLPVTGSISLLSWLTL